MHKLCGIVLAVGLTALVSVPVSAVPSDEAGFWAALGQADAATQRLVASNAFFAEVVLTASVAADDSSRASESGYFRYPDGSFRAYTGAAFFKGQGDARRDILEVDREAMCTAASKPKKGKKRTVAKCWVRDTSVDDKWHAIERRLVNVTVTPFMLDRAAFAEQFAARAPIPPTYGVVTRADGTFAVTARVVKESQTASTEHIGNWMQFQADIVPGKDVSQFLNDVNWQNPEGIVHKVESQTTNLKLNSRPPRIPYKSDLGVRQSSPFNITVTYLLYGN